MELFHAVLLGIVEGITEFLPISSTGHLILVSRLLQLPPSAFLTTFEIVIQLGAIFAAVVLYWQKLLLNRAILARVLVALLPALGVGFVFYSTIKKMLGSDSTVLWALLIGGVLIILFEFFHQSEESIDDVSTISFRTAFLIGLFQSLAVIPGVSRAGATILGGLWLGMKRATIVEFSFLLAIPTMLAATALQLIKNAPILTLDNINVLAVGFLAAFFVALLSIKSFLRFIGTHTFLPFGVYRIGVALLLFLILF